MNAETSDRLSALPTDMLHEISQVLDAISILWLAACSKYFARILMSERFAKTNAHKISEEMARGKNVLNLAYYSSDKFTAPIINVRYVFVCSLQSYAKRFKRGKGNITYGDVIHCKFINPGSSRISISRYREFSNLGPNGIHKDKIECILSLRDVMAAVPEVPAELLVERMQRFFGDNHCAYFQQDIPAEYYFDMYSLRAHVHFCGGCCLIAKRGLPASFAEIMGVKFASEYFLSLGADMSRVAVMRFGSRLIKCESSAIKFAKIVFSGNADAPVADKSAIARLLEFCPWLRVAASAIGAKLL